MRKRGRWLKTYIVGSARGRARDYYKLGDLGFFQDGSECENYKGQNFRLSVPRMANLRPFSPLCQLAGSF